MTFIESAILGLVQGLTEFLPVSSSGHLVLGQHLLQTEVDATLIFEVLVHLGTLAAVVTVYRREIWNLIRYLFVQAPQLIKERGWRNGGAEAFWRREDGRFITGVVVITIITGVVGLAIKDTIEPLFQSVSAVGIALMITALLLTLSILGRERFQDAGAIPLWVFIAVGVAQTMALTPGISRSGSTIAVALLLGVDRKTAGALSFIASIPAILGATLLEVKDGPLDFQTLAPSLLGMGVAAVVGWVALVFVLQFVRQGRFWIFAPYCLIVGLLAWLGFFN